MLRVGWTVDALTEDGQVTHVGDETVGAAQLLDEVGGRGRTDRGDLATTAADQVEVLGRTRRVIGRRPVGEVGVPDETELLQHLEVAIDRGGVDRAFQALADLIWSGVTQRLDRSKHQLALRSEAIAAPPQPGGQVIRHEAQTRFSRAHRWGWSSWPIAAMS